MNENLLTIAVVVNIVIAAVVLYNLFTRYLVDRNPAAGITVGHHIFRFFTIDSNLLMGITALIAAVYELKLVNGDIAVIPRRVVILKFCATVAVGLTMLVTAGFLAPRAEAGYLSMFRNENLFFHFLVPLVSILLLVTCERGFALTFREALWALVPTAAYAVYYSADVFTHIKDGKAAAGHDWYGFVTHGVKYAPVAVFALSAATFVILTLLWLGCAL